MSTGRARVPALLIVAVIVGLLAAGTSLAATVGKPAGILRPRPTQESFSPLVVSPVTYHGGPVETSPMVYIDFWGWSGDPQGAQSYVRAFLAGIGGTAWNGTNSQYCEGVAVGSSECPVRARHVGDPTGLLYGSWRDSADIPSQPSERQVAEEAARAAAHFGITQPTPNVQIVVATPTGHSTPGFGTSFCAYHSTYGNSSGTISFTNLPYQPDAGSHCGENTVNAGSAGTFDGYGIVEGHELAETETDPQPQSGWNQGSGGTEVGDLCAWKELGDISTAEGTFAVQPLWSNSSLSCAMASPVPQTPAAAPSVAHEGSSWWLYYRELHGALSEQSLTGSAWSEYQIGSAVAGGTTPAVVHEGGSWWVFYQGNDGALWEESLSSGKWTESRIGGQLAAGTNPVVVHEGGSWWVFYQGSNGALWEESLSSGKWTESQIGGKLAANSSPAVVHAGGSWWVFYQGSDGALWEESLTGSSWAEYRIGGQFAANSSPAVVHEGGSWWVYFQGSDGALWEESLMGSSWAESRIGSALAPGSSPVVVHEGGSWWVYFQGSDGALWEESLTGSAWAEYRIGGHL